MNDKTLAEVLSKFNLEQITVLDQACEAISESVESPHKKYWRSVLDIMPDDQVMVAYAIMGMAAVLGDNGGDV